MGEGGIKARAGLSSIMSPAYPNPGPSRGSAADGSVDVFTGAQPEDQLRDGFLRQLQANGGRPAGLWNGCLLASRV